jgi:hypothetical protein
MRLQKLSVAAKKKRHINNSRTRFRVLFDDRLSIYLDLSLRRNPLAYNYIPCSVPYKSGRERDARDGRQGEEKAQQFAQGGAEKEDISQQRRRTYVRTHARTCTSPQTRTRKERKIAKRAGEKSSATWWTAAEAP